MDSIPGANGKNICSRAGQNGHSTYVALVAGLSLPVHTDEQNFSMEHRRPSKRMQHVSEPAANACSLTHYLLETALHCNRTLSQTAQNCYTTAAPCPIDTGMCHHQDMTQGILTVLPGMTNFT